MKKIAIILLFPFCANSQELDWEKSYGGKHADYLLDAIPTADYGFILAGSSLSGRTGGKTQDNRGDLDYWVWKMDEKGDPDWQKSFGGSGADLLYSIAGTPDGGFLLGGTSESGKTPGVKARDCQGQEDYWVIKLDAKGSEDWQRTLGGRGQDILAKVAVARDGGYLLGGSSSSPRCEDKKENSRGSLDFWIVKLDAKGNTLWERTLGGKHRDVLRSLAATADGGCIAGGHSNSPSGDDRKSGSSGAGDFWVVKLDAGGRVEWEEAIGGSGDDDLHAIIQTRDGGYLAGGSSNSAPARNGTDMLAVRLDAQGGKLWQQHYDFGAMDILSSLLENEDGTLLAGGHARSQASGGKASPQGIGDYIALKLSDKGDILWTRTVGSGGEDQLRKAIATRDGGYLLAGMSWSGKASRERRSQIGRTDFWVVKLRDSERKEKERLPIEAIPNPAVTHTNIIIGHDFRHGTATLYDLGGRQLHQQEIGSRTVPIDMGALPQGIYIVEVRTDAGDSSVKVMKN